MTRIRGSRLVLWCAPAAMMVLAGCGSGSAASPAGPASGASGSALASGPARSSPGAASAGPAGGGHFCDVVRGQAGLLQGTEVSSLLTGGSPAAWKAYLDRVTAMNTELVDAAPPQVKASVVTLREATVELRASLAAAGYDVTKVGSVKLLKLLQTPQRRQAMAAMTAYVRTTCGIDLTRPGG